MPWHTGVFRDFAANESLAATAGADYCVWSPIVPVVIGMLVCGVTVNVSPAMQYEYDVA